MDRPLIGITGPDRGGLSAWLFGAWAVFRAGGRPRRITPGRPHLGTLDGLIIGGGSDVSPSLYESDPDPSAPLEDAGERVVGLVLGLIRRLFARDTPGRGLDPARDALETAWLERALSDRVPVLGICRGMQLLNVVSGGNLIRDVRPLYTEHAYIRSVWPRKRVQIEPRSRLAQAVGGVHCRVNALHQQAVGRLGAGLRVVAWEPSGVVQAIEGRDPGAFVLGLQWHPEWLPQRQDQLRVFRAFVGAAHHRLREAGPGSRLPQSSLQLGD